MKHGAKLAILLITNPLWAFNAGHYWQCTSSDSDNKQWLAQGIFERAATSKAFDACKKQSRVPGTCRTDPGVCAGFDYDVSIQAVWRCTALDQDANPWVGRAYSQDDAVMIAKALCREHSTIPGSCFINLLTCAPTREQ